MSESQFRRCLRAAALAGAVAVASGCRSAEDDSPADIGGEVRSAISERSRADATLTTDEAVADEIDVLVRAGLDDETAVRLALLTNRTLRASYDDLDIATADRVRAGLLTNPTASLGVSVFQEGPQVNAALTQPILDLFLRPLREARADAELDLVGARVARVGVEIAFDVRRLLARTRAAAAERAVRARAMQVADAANDLMVALDEAGNARPLHVARVARDAARARLELGRAEAAERESTDALIERIGLFGAAAAVTVAPAADSLVDPAASIDLDHVERDAIRASLQLEEHRALLNAVEQDGALARIAARFPTASLGAQFTREAPGPAGLGPAGSLSLPVLDDGSNATAWGERVRRRQEHLYEAEAIDTRSAARRLRDRLVEARERWRFVDEVLTATERQVVEQQVLSYNAMQIGAFEVLEARRSELDLESQRIRARLDCTIAGLDLQELLAGNRNPTRVADQPIPALEATPMQSGEGAMER